MQQAFDFPVTPMCTFESFVACDGNSGALEFARRIADPDEPENLLYLYGPHGSGKTHLLTAIGRVAAGNSGKAAPCLSCREQFTAGEIGLRFAGASVLLVDDLQLLPDDAERRIALWQLFNEFHSAGRKIAMAGLCPPRELDNLDDHLVSRLLWGLVSRVDASDDHSRRMIIRKIADDRQVRIADDVIDFILVTTSREVSALIAAFESLYRYSLASNRRISLHLAREVREMQQSGIVT